MKKYTLLLALMTFLSPCLTVAGTATNSGAPVEHKLNIKLKFTPGLYAISGVERKIDGSSAYKKSVGADLCSGSLNPLYFLSSKKNMMAQVGKRVCHINILVNKDNEYSANVLCGENKSQSVDATYTSKLLTKKEFLIGYTSKTYAGGHIASIMTFSGRAHFKQSNCARKLKSVPYDSLHGEKNG